jgi:hypothetical protein
MHGKEALIRYDQGFTVLPIENKKFSMEKDPLKTIMRWGEILNGSTIKKPGYETGGRGLSTRGVQAGFTGMNKQGFDDIMNGGVYKNSNKRALFGKGSRPILGRGAYSAPTMEGASRYKKPGGGIVKTIVPRGAVRSSLVDIFEPQQRVATATFDKGKALADKLLSGKYANSPLANKLLTQMMSGTARTAPKVAAFSKLAAGLLKLSSKAVGILNAPVVGDMLFPEGAGNYSQVSGPNAYYNAPGYKASVTAPRAAAGVKSKPIIVTMPVSSASAPVAQVSGGGSAPDTIKPLRQPAQTAAQIMERSNARRFH